MSDPKIEKLNKYLDMLRSRRAQMIARASTTERRAKARQAIILGSWLLAKRPDLVEAIKVKLVRPQDRKAFGLPELCAAPRAEQPDTGGN